MSPDIHQPIILLGTGRCGSTALHEILSLHPQVAWLSDLCNRLPSQPQYNHSLMSALDLPLIGRLLQGRFSPGENYLFWEQYARGFRKSFRDLTAADVTENVKQDVREVMARMLTPRRARLLLKITGWSRIGYLHEIFPDAKFIHIVRDGRAVANSMLNVDFWDGWLGPGGWRWGPLSAARQCAWEQTGCSFVALAGLEWVIMQEAVAAAKTALCADNFLEIRYEDFCADKTAVTRRLLEFAGLDWSPGFERRVRAFPVANQNYKWRKDLTAEQQAILTDIQREHLALLGYSL
jgi:hypothetical protein